MLLCRKSFMAGKTASPAPYNTPIVGAAGVIDVGFLVKTKWTFHDYILSFNYKKIQWKSVEKWGKQKPASVTMLALCYFIYLFLEFLDGCPGCARKRA